ncbi:hypothetical protein BU15DRAFT_81891 [Melanogaster broomeanus]|nr:hypothetical protein BU15DRAFT_81891 [Melanogaster broomeanus]
MPSFPPLRPFNPVPSAPLRTLDALSLFQEDEVVITSPNMTFIPKPFLNSSELRAFKDSRYGVQDVFQWPQLYSDKYPPPSIVIWKEAWSAVDQAPHRVWADVPKPAVYPFPDPALFMTVKSDECKALYFRNWLLSCPAWINRVYIQDIEATARLFGPEFLDLHSSAADADTLAAVSFRDIVLDLRDFSQVSKEILRRVIWDLYDHAFYFDFLMLDRVLCLQAWASDFEERIGLITAVFGSKSILANWTTPFPLENHVGKKYFTSQPLISQ